MKYVCDENGRVLNLFSDTIDVALLTLWPELYVHCYIDLHVDQVPHLYDECILDLYKTGGWARLRTFSVHCFSSGMQVLLHPEGSYVVLMKRGPVPHVTAGLSDIGKGAIREVIPSVKR
jgi:hypothetical protein